MPLSIRDAIPADAPLILRFIRELAIYEKLEHAVTANEALIRQNLFSANATTHALILEQTGIAVGFAVYFYNFSTFLGKRGIYIEDVYVSPEHRGAGAGTAVFKHLAAKALKEDCGRLEWWVLDWNETAIQFYKKIGAVAMDEWTVYRVEGEALTKLATQTLAVPA